MENGANHLENNDCVQKLWTRFIVTIGKNVENGLININPVTITSSVTNTITNMETMLVTIPAMSPGCPRDDSVLSRAV